VLALLLRLRIAARLHRSPQGRGGPVLYELEVRGRRNLERFLRSVGTAAVPDGREGAGNGLDSQPITDRAGRLLPFPLWPDASRRRSPATFSASALGRARAAAVTEIVDSAELLRLTTSDVCWDEVVSIEPDGEDDVYDLTVEGLHSFVADCVVVHNSLEQDADLVLFIYRDEHYNPDESPDKGLAEIILSKHRNGPTGVEKLSFLSRYAKFADLAQH
jgi:replicative DNA helicase